MIFINFFRFPEQAKCRENKLSNSFPPTEHFLDWTYISPTFFPRPNIHFANIISPTEHSFRRHIFSTYFQQTFIFFLFISLVTSLQCDDPLGTISQKKSKTYFLMYFRKVIFVYFFWLQNLRVHPFCDKFEVVFLMLLSEHKIHFFRFI